ncbi:MAG TPA: vanadium-dependent haloperoxidase [Pyrinomonadaceae bacterium]|nr:vanadium-dependent haloperoxidase [Pyrinomonadaceae bacterium]
MKNTIKSLTRSFRLLVVLTVVAAFGSVARADAVTDWNAIAVQTVVAAGPTRPGPAGAIDLAVVNAAIYDAVQAIEKDYQSYYVEVPGASGNPAAAAAKAAHDVLVIRFPLQAASLDTQYANYLIANGIPTTDPGIAVGTAAAAGILALRSCDGSLTGPPPSFTGGTAIGQWRPTPPANSAMNPGPWFGQITPFFMTRPFQFRSDPPPALTSKHYARDYNEVKSLGSATGSSRTPEQTDQANFYAGNFVAMMNKVARDLAIEHLDSISDSSRLLALVSMSQADAGINTWNDKAYYVFWRPITAIQNGDLDGNGRTEGDATWTPMIATPPYPDYGSGANALTSATMQSLENFFGTDKMSFSITTTNTGPTMLDTRNFESFSDAAQEVVDARVLLGIHFRFADEAARTQGRKVANYGHKNYLKPLPGGDEDLAEVAMRVGR